MQHVDFLATAQRALEQIERGAFLTVQAGDRVNMMTIGWASLGFIWGRPMMTVLVRRSRFTWDIIEQAADFTVSVPLVDARSSLEICGTHSGRKIDKRKKCGLEYFPSEKVKTPIVAIQGIHYECKIVYKSPLVPGHLIESYKHLYPEKDYHSFYYGEVVFCYSTEDEKSAKKQ
ncbi:MAG: flavin reductase family protein [Chitinispirillaceae bacterium]|nr:flavin reductase family protein [Chitinispirillaceae bacterium]